MIKIILLAAGISSRMGNANKLLLPFGKKTLLEATFSRIEASAIGEITVVVGHAPDRIRALLQDRACRIVENPHYAKGMTTSIQAGVAAAGAGATGFLIALGDMPLIAPEEYRLLAQVFNDRLRSDPNVIVQPQYQGQRGNPVLFTVVYQDELLALDHPQGARPVIQAHRDHLLLVDMPTDAVLTDADTPESYQRLLTRQKGPYI